MDFYREYVQEYQLPWNTLVVSKASVMLLIGQASVAGDDFCITWCSVQIGAYLSVYDITAKC